VFVCVCTKNPSITPLCHPGHALSQSHLPKTCAFLVIHNVAGVGIMSWPHRSGQPNALCVHPAKYGASIESKLWVTTRPPCLVIQVLCAYLKHHVGFGKYNARAMHQRACVHARVHEACFLTSAKAGLTKLPKSCLLHWLTVFLFYILSFLRLCLRYLPCLSCNHDTNRIKSSQAANRLNLSQREPTSRPQCK